MLVTDIVYLIAASISTTCLAAVLIIMLVHKEIKPFKQFSTRLCFIVFAGNIVFDVAITLGILIPQEFGACQWIASFKILGELTGLLGVSYISWLAMASSRPLELVSTSEKSKQYLNPLTVEKKFWLMAGTYILIATFLPLATQNNGNYLQGCWVRTDFNEKWKQNIGVFERILAVIFPTVVVFAWNTYATIRSTQYLQRDKGKGKLLNQRLANKLRYYPVILLVCYALDFFSLFYELIAQKTFENTIFNSFQLFFLGIYGACNALYFGLGNYVSLFVIYARARELNDNNNNLFLDSECISSESLENPLNQNQIYQAKTMQQEKSKKMSFESDNTKLSTSAGNPSNQIDKSYTSYDAADQLTPNAQLQQEIIGNQKHIKNQQGNGGKIMSHSSFQSVFTRESYMANIRPKSSQVQATPIIVPVQQKVYHDFPTLSAANSSAVVASSHPKEDEEVPVAIQFSPDSNNGIIDEGFSMKKKEAIN